MAVFGPYWNGYSDTPGVGGIGETWGNSAGDIGIGGIGNTNKLWDTAWFDEMIALLDARTGHGHSMEAATKVYLLREGCKVLDRSGDHSHLRSRHILPVDKAGRFLYKLDDQIRMVHGVDVLDENDVTTPLTKSFAKELKAAWPNLRSSDSWGFPQGWAYDYGHVMLALTSPINDLEMAIDDLDVRLDEHPDQQMLLIAPPPSSTLYRLDLAVSFYSPIIRKGGYANYWVRMYPEAVANAAMHVYQSQLGDQQLSTQFLAAAMVSINAYILDQVQIETDDLEMEMEG